MIIYLLVFILSLIFLSLSEKTNIKFLAFCFILLSILVPSALAGCRDISIGTDTGGYPFNYFADAKYFHSLLSYVRYIHTDIFFALLEWFNYNITKNFNCLLFFIQFINISFVYLAIFNLKKEHDLSIVFAAFLYYFAFYNMSLNASRQIMAMSVCLYSFSYLLRVDFKRAIFIAIIAIGFHKTSIIYLTLIPIYKIYLEKKNQDIDVRRYCRYTFLFFAIIFYSYSKLIDLFINQGFLLDRFSNYGSTDIWKPNIPFSDLFFSVFVIFSYYSIKGENIVTWYLLSFFKLIAAISFIGCFLALKSMYVVRIIYYFNYLIILSLPLLFIDQKIKIGFYNLKPKFFVGTIIVFYWFTRYIYANLGETYPYTSKILGI